MLEENKIIELKDGDLEKTSGGIKHKTSKRRTANWKKASPETSICPNCHEPKLPHRVCSNCGFYEKINNIE